MTRKGKIARLPEHIREHINRRLQDGENGREIIAWLNTNDEVRTLLAQKFGGYKINDTNLSQWRRGGFRDWQARQAALTEACRITSEETGLSETGGTALAHRLAVWLLARYIVAARKVFENGHDPKIWKLLRELCHDLVALRRGDPGATWPRLEQERKNLSGI